MSNQAPAEFIIPSSPADRQKITDAIQEAVNSLTRIDAEKDNIKAIETRLKDELGLPKDLFKELVKTHNERALGLKRLKFERLEDTYTTLYGSDEE